MTQWADRTCGNHLDERRAGAGGSAIVTSEERHVYLYERTGLQIFRTRANRVVSLRYAECARTGAIAENTAIELHLRSWNSCPIYRKPFDLFAEGSKTGDWLLGLDSNQQPSG